MRFFFRVPEAKALLGLFGAGLVVSVGTFWAFQRGALDFSVFYEAWHLVLQGRGMEIYSATPDRFLYAPGFAWIFALLGYLPRDLALAFWCFAKAAALGLILREFSTIVQRSSRIRSLGICAWGMLCVSRPILIDFQYGQVNLFILAAAVWALMGHFQDTRPSFLNGLSWFVLTVFAVAKIFPLPLLLVPWILSSSSPQKKHFERLGILVGLLTMIVLPLWTLGGRDTLWLFLQWKQAVFARGLPLESHNQSFAAFLHHYFSEQPTHVIALGMHAVPLGLFTLSQKSIHLIAMGWTWITFGILLAWIFTSPSQAWPSWVAVVLGLLIMPSHLVWKPYFVFGLPAAIVGMNIFSRHKGLFFIVFFGMNCTGFDFLGDYWSSRLEAGSLMLWMHIVLLTLALVQVHPLHLRVIPPTSSGRGF